MSATTKSGKSSSVQHFKPGEIIFSQGDTAEHVFIVTEGEVELLIGDKVIATEQQGGIIGEMALLNESTRSATARAKSACLLDAIDHEGFLSLVKISPEFSLHVMRVMAERIRHASQVYIP